MALSHSPSIVTNGLVLCLDAGNNKSYPGTGTAWNDMSGAGNNGTLTNGPTYSSTDGGSILFDGSNDYVVFSNTTSLQFLNRLPYTLECWFRLGAIPSLFTYPGLFHREATVGGGRNGYGLVIACNTTNKLSLGTERHTPSGTIFVYTEEVDSSPLVGVWKHLCGAYDDTTLSLYLDGKFVTSQTQTTNITNTTTALNIGRLVSSYFNGRISCPRIYNRALSAAEIAQNFNALRGRFGL